ncbi:u3 small nucleolar RNA-interacting protein [Anaeramoeba flamelloides]|uniref:U3 small nucleolar RNA-interacting protein n=1 Tax=Anaeramoeba flamelloides TaxID=1746091 RepID=A0AAV7Z555_9EUKA|nr:u3 small nucleolar RNA-interacting protein [Anaeramoeba flamelloides]
MSINDPFLVFNKAKRSKFDRKTNYKKRRYNNTKRNDEEIISSSSNSSSQEEDLMSTVNKSHQKKQIKKQKAIEQEAEEEEEKIKETPQQKRLRISKDILKSVISQGLIDESTQTFFDEDQIKLYDQKLRDKLIPKKGFRMDRIAEKISESNLKSPKITIKRNRSLPFTCMVMDKKGNFAYTASKNGLIYKWDLKTLTKEKFANNQKNTILCIALSSSGTHLATGCSSNLVTIWNTQTLKCIGALKGHRKPVSGVSFRTKSLELFSCSFDGTIKIWNVEEMGFMETLFGHEDNCMAIDCLSAERPVSSGSDKTFRMWKIASESHLIFDGVHEKAIECIKYLNDSIIIAGGQDGNLSVWNTNKKKPIQVIEDAHDGKWICSIMTVPFSDLVMTGSFDGFIRIWQIQRRNDHLLEIGKIPIPGFINSLSITSDHKRIIACVAREHRLGRWYNLSKVKGGLYIIELK